jgi:hypothetical protein
MLSDSEARDRDTLALMTHQDRYRTERPGRGDGQVACELHPDGAGQRLRRDPQRKPNEIGCVFAGADLRIGELSPDAYAALLDEL